MNPFRKLAVVGTGPICSECIHVHPGPCPDRPDLWRCSAVRTTARDAYSRHIDGKGAEAVVEYGWCTHHNNKGECKRFEPQAGRCEVGQ